MARNLLASRLLTTAAIALSGVRFASAAPTVTQLLPASTKAYAATDDIHRLDADWKKSRIAAIFDDAKMRPFVDEIERIYGREASGDVSSANISWGDLLKVSAGPACTAVVAVEKNKPASILLVNTRGKRPQVVELIKQLTVAYKKLGATRTNHTIDGHRTIVYEHELKDGKKKLKVQRIYFLRDDIFGTTDNLTLLKGVFGRWNTPASDSIAKLASFQSILRTASEALPKGHARGTWFLDPFGYERLFRGSKKAANNAGWPRAVRQGFAGIQAVGGIVSFPAGELDAVHHLAVYAPEPLKKAAGMLAFDPLGDTAMPKWVPADIGRAALLNWNLSAAFTAYGSWFDDVYGEGETGIFEEVVLGIRDDPGSPGVDIRKDLLANLQGPVTVVGGTAHLKAASGDPILLAIKATNEPRVRAAVGKMLSGDPDVDRRDVGPTKAWVFRDTRKKKPDDEAFGPNLSNVAVCLHDGYLMVATDVALLKSVLAEKSRVGPLATDRRYDRVMRLIDARSDKRTILRLYANPGVDLRVLYEQLRAGKIQDVTSLRGRMIAALVNMTSTTAPRRALPLTKLPAFDVVRPYLGTGGTIGRRNNDGWSILSFTLSDKTK